MRWGAAATIASGTEAGWSCDESTREGFLNALRQIHRRTSNASVYDSKRGARAMNKHIGTTFNAAMIGIALATATTLADAAPPEPFKITNIHFETNSSACDMGIQISFDTEGVTVGEVEDPFEQSVFSFRSVFGAEGTKDLTEMFQERVEPPIIDLERALGCEHSEDAIWLSDLLAAWPAGRYEFDGESGRRNSKARPGFHTRFLLAPRSSRRTMAMWSRTMRRFFIRWRKVTTPLLNNLGPVEIVGYHVVVVDITNEVLPPGKTKTAFDVDLAKSEVSLTVPKQYLEPGRMYEFEVLATEKGGNQTITEGGVFCRDADYAG